MQQNKNMMLFAILSLCVLVGWVWVQNHFWPQKKLPPNPAPEVKGKEEKEVKKNKEEIKEAKLPSRPFNEHDLGQLAALLNFEPLTITGTWAEVMKRLAPSINPNDPFPLTTALNPQSASVVGPWRFALTLNSMEKTPAKATPVPEAPKIAAISEEFETVPLGFAVKDGAKVTNDKYHMEVLLTTRGAGVRQLFLNKFNAANYLGLPVPEKDALLELIPDDPIVPSYLMYHYRFGPDGLPLDNVGKDGGKEPVPVDTLGRLKWEIDKRPASIDDEQRASFSVQIPDQPIRITKTYILSPEAYHLEVAVTIADTRESGDPRKFRYQLAGSHGIPVEGEYFVTTPRTAVMGIYNKQRKQLGREPEESSRISFLGGGTRVPEANLGPNSFLQYAGVMNQFFFSSIVVDDEQIPRKNSGDDPQRFLAWVRPTVESTEKVGRIAVLDDNFLMFESRSPVDRRRMLMERFEVLPRVLSHIKECKIVEEQDVVLSYYDTGKEKVATWIRLGHTPRPTLDDITVRMVSQEFDLKPGERLEHKYVLYNGPSKVTQLYDFTGINAVPAKLVEKYADGLHLRTVADYGRFWLWTDLILACTKLMHFLLSHLRFLGDGMSIVLLTVLVRGLMFPVSRKQAIYSVKMQALAPEMKKIQEKFKDDPKARTEATMEMYRKHNVHPLGGCLPILLQMPIFIGLYFALQESVHFRLGTFLWIENLAAPDMLIGWGQSIPIISDPNCQGGVVMDKGFLRWLATVPNFFYLGPFFNLLPVIAVTFMIIQQKVMTPPPQDEQQAAQFKMMRYMMVVVGLMFYKVAAGLAMYIIISTVWGLSERRFLPKKQSAAAPPPNPLASPSPGGKQRTPSGRKQPQRKAPEKKEGIIQKGKDWWQEVLKQAKKK